MAIKLHLSFAVHPGEWLRAEIVEPAGLSVTALAERLNVTRQAASNLLNGNAGLSPEMAIRFEKAFGLSVDTLLRMQAAHQLAEARKGRVRSWWRRLEFSRSGTGEGAASGMPPRPLPELWRSACPAGARADDGGGAAGGLLSSLCTSRAAADSRRATVRDHARDPDVYLLVM